MHQKLFAISRQNEHSVLHLSIVIKLSNLKSLNIFVIFIYYHRGLKCNATVKGLIEWNIYWNCKSSNETLDYYIEGVRPKNVCKNL